MKVTFLPQNIIAEAEEGETVLKAAARAGIVINGGCAGRGICGSCKVKIIKGAAEPVSNPGNKLTEHEIAEGYRLACCQIVSGEMVIEVSEAETTAARKKNLICLPEGFEPAPSVEKICAEISAAKIGDQGSDAGRIMEALGKKQLHFSIDALRKIPEVLQCGSTVTAAVRRGEIIDLEAGNTAAENYGVAVDMGTTTVVVMLWNLHTGELVDTFASVNPQGVYGADVISRSTFVMEKAENLEILRCAVTGCIQKAVLHFAEVHHFRTENIYQYTVVGNTVMSHIFSGIMPEGLTVSPFAPVFTAGVHMSAEDLGLAAAKGAIVYTGPNLAGHVGSDITAGLLTLGDADWNRVRLFIDIGTNGEIVLTGKGRALTCSVAAGPAFEGGNISRGMGAAKGAVERVEILDDAVEFSVIGGGAPVGICGSGIIDAAGELVRRGIVDRSGRILDKKMLREKGISDSILKHIRESGRANDFTLYFGAEGKVDLVITQKDIRQVQMAKAAVFAGIAVLMKEIGVSARDIAEVNIAGAFGSYIRSAAAMRIGLIPEVSEDKIRFLGNSAGIGASMLLLSEDCRRKAEGFAAEIEHIELAARSDFQEMYMEAMAF